MLSFTCLFFYYCFLATGLLVNRVIYIFRLNASILSTYTCVSTKHTKNCFKTWSEAVGQIIRTPLHQNIWSESSGL